MADGPFADTEAFAQLRDGREAFARLPAAGLEITPERFGDLL